jgi:putrescine transport system permease protein
VTLDSLSLPPQVPDSVFGRVWRWLVNLWRLSPVRGLALVLRGKTLVTLVPYLWLVVFFLAPFLLVLKISLAQAELGRPPYTALLELVDQSTLHIRLYLGNYLLLARDSLYVHAFLNSLRVAAVSTLLCLGIGYPMAYAIARARPGLRAGLLLLIILPFWTSFLLRVYAWIGILKTNGILNGVLLSLGLIDEPMALLHTDFAVYLGIVYSYLPFMVLPLYATLVRLDMTLLEAAADLGCRPFRAFLEVTLPMSMPGVVAGSMLVFVPAVGEFVIPDLLGGPDSLMIGRVLWSEFFSNRDWPVASALAVALLVLLVAPVILFERARQRQAERETPQ